MAPHPAGDRVALDDADGRVLFDDLRTDRDLPAFDYSAMDGYAVASAVFAGDGPFVLDVRGESQTGREAPPLEPGTTCRIFTGAAMPKGADTVVMQERVTREKDKATFQASPKPGACVRRRGEDMLAGSIALKAGTRLSAAHLALAAMIDQAWLNVARRPVVTILSTGDELRAPGSAGSGVTIPESNSVALRAMARAAGAVARVGPYVRDDRAATEEAFETALRGTDVLVTVGGVSVGDHDLVRPALEKIGVALEFWKVAIKPGKPLAVGRRGDTIVLGLPGNPASAMITFALFGVPLLRALQGDRDPLPATLRAHVSRAIPHEPGRLDFARAWLTREGEHLRVEPLSNQASAAVTSMATANALMCIPLSSTGLVADEMVDVLPFPSLCL